MSISTGPGTLIDLPMKLALIFSYRTFYGKVRTLDLSSECLVLVLVIYHLRAGTSGVKVRGQLTKEKVTDLATSKFKPTVG